ncbi:hypothetical protein SAMN06269117_102106 [Balnearium lithotrophicum]|uniref:Lysylphosphatidylglycerol synthase TM region n=1 Tax=Balnearium lithotrophicum TaxID=223788 RepID=A0A521ASQ1_9BACT|nr:lysylphosphatidylglycerol synthase transmembrane domain-containing protein [Balnearium lithotrophicum]SMO37819.1 hypothetical protein SAMN06269117_102106 [Balnearium lithotrophicum]
MKRNSLLVSLIILSIFIYFLVEYNVFSKLNEILNCLSPIYLFLSLIIYISTYFLRAKRFTLFFPEIKTLDLSAVMAVHTFFNNLLPFRSGEASFPIILKKLFSVEGVISSATLLLVRLFDLLSLSILFTLSTVFISFQNKKLLLISVFLFFFILLIIFIGFKLLRKFKNKFPIAFTLFSFFSNFNSKKNLTLVFTYSILNWTFKFLSFFFILKAGGINISFPKTIFVATFGELTTVLPIHSIGGFGTYEAGLVGGFALLGLKGSYALTVAFYFHLLLFTMSGVLAFFGWIYLSGKFKG